MNNTEDVLNPIFKNYHLLSCTYDEYFSCQGTIHEEFATIIKHLQSFSLAELNQKNQRAQDYFRTHGVTFKTNSSPDKEGIFPFDILPRMITANEWDHLSQGLIQRVQALNLFLSDIYGEQRIIKDKILPQSLIENSDGYIPAIKGMKPPGGVYIMIEGCDLIRQNDGKFYILEDNLRTPSGVSYLLKNRQMMEHLFPTWMDNYKVAAVNEYPHRLLKTLTSLTPHKENPLVVVLTPGPFNCAYFEHKYLAKEMNCPLVENTDLYVENRKVYMKINGTKKQVDIIYKRTDDQFLDPSVFRKDSLLGIRGIIDAHFSGSVVLANGVGNGIADDKAIYEYVPLLIRYYLGEDPKLPQIPTYFAGDTKERSYILSHLHELVIKMVNQSGGYGMLIGPQASKNELEQFKEKIKASPNAYIAQPLIDLSTMPVIDEEKYLKPHRIDLRAYILTGKDDSWVLPGALTRVALKEGSYIVNSSQGGGSKDTWIVPGEANET